MEHRVDDDIFPFRKPSGKNANKLSGDEEEVCFPREEKTTHADEEECGAPQREETEHCLFWYGSDEEDGDRTEQMLEITARGPKEVSERQAASIYFQLRCNRVRCERVAYCEPTSVHAALETAERNLEISNRCRTITPEELQIVGVGTTADWEKSDKLQMGFSNKNGIKMERPINSERGWWHVVLDKFYGTDFYETYAPVLKHQVVT